MRNIIIKILLCFLLVNTAFALFEYTGPLDDLNSDFLVTDGAITGLVSVTDGTASWLNNSLSGFTSISGITLTDTVLSINGGSISSAVNGTFSGIIRAGTFDWTAADITTTGTITGGTLTDGTFIATGGVVTAGAWQGSTITVPYGGTGATSLTDGGLLVGSDTSAITALGVLADGAFIVGDGTTDPVAESGSTARTSLGLGTIATYAGDQDLQQADSPTFGGLTITGTVDTPELSNTVGDLKLTINPEGGDVHFFETKDYGGSAPSNKIYVHNEGETQGPGEIYKDQWSGRFAFANPDGDIVFEPNAAGELLFFDSIFTHTGSYETLSALSNDYRFRWQRGGDGDQDAFTNALSFRGMNEEGVHEYMKMSGHPGASNQDDLIDVYSPMAFSGDITFAGSAGFYPRRIKQNAEPVNGTGATQIDVGEFIIWIDDDDADKVHLMYNDTDTGVVGIELAATP